MWARAHRRFHRTLIPEAGREFARTLSTYFDRAERLRRMFQTEEIAGGVRLNEEHEAILRACKAKNASKAAALVARHSARAALTLMAQISPERDRLDLDGNAFGLVEGLAVDSPLRGPRLRIESDLAGPELARLVDGDEGRLDQVAERAALRRHAVDGQPLVERTRSSGAQHPVEDHSGREVADHEAD